MYANEKCRLSTANTQTANKQALSLPNENTRENVSVSIVSHSGQEYKPCNVNVSTVPRMRTIKQTAELAGVAEYFVRRLCKSGQFTGFVKAGNKTLINFDRVVDFLNGGESV
jgi:hypothetical protein